MEDPAQTMPPQESFNQSPNRTQVKETEAKETELNTQEELGDQPRYSDQQFNNDGIDISLQKETQQIGDVNNDREEILNPEVPQEVDVEIGDRKGDGSKSYL